MQNDEELFWQEMRDVTPMARASRVRSTAGERSRDASLQERRAAAVTEKAKDDSLLSDRDDIEGLDPWYVLDFKRPGVQNGVFRKLKQGRYEVEAVLDLHRMTVEVARREIDAFIKDSQVLGLRSVMVVHGKNESASPDISPRKVKKWRKSL